MGLREEKKQATRTALSWAAIHLIVELGYDKVLVEDIAGAAGVSARTFNNYFASKAEAVAHRHLNRCQEIAAELRKRPAGEPLWDAITAAVVTQLTPGPEVTGNPVTDPVAWAAGLREMLAVPAIQAEYLRASAIAEEAIAAAVAERTGTDPADLYPQLVAAALLAVNNVASRSFSETDGMESVPAVIADALHQLSTGLQPPISRTR